MRQSKRKAERLFEMNAKVPEQFCTRSDAQSFTRFAARCGEPLNQILASVAPEAYHWAIISYLRIAFSRGETLEQVTAGTTPEVCQLVQQCVATANRRGA